MIIMAAVAGSISTQKPQQQRKNWRFVAVKVKLELISITFRAVNLAFIRSHLSPSLRLRCVRTSFLLLKVPNLNVNLVLIRLRSFCVPRVYGICD